MTTRGRFRAGAVMLVLSVTTSVGAQLLRPTPAAPPSQQASSASSRPTAATLVLFQAWIAAVTAHSPGRADEHVIAVRQWTPADRALFSSARSWFLVGLTGKGPRPTDEMQQRLVQIGRDLALAGRRAFIRRVAIFHSDVVMYGGPAPLEPVTSGSADGVLIVTSDGEYQGQIAGDWNWPIARSLLIAIAPDPKTDPFVADWYHATTAYMLGRRMFGEAVWHLQSAAALLPDEPRILLDQGCLWEVLGMPRTQAVVGEQDRVALRQRQAGARLPASLSEAAQSIPAMEIANANAERFYRRAIGRDPGVFEAQVRLGRLLTVRGRHAEADRELTRAIAGTSDPDLLYYAHLFAARANHRLDRLDVAVQHLDAAARLFGDAQSLLVARSQLALVRADVAGALAPLEAIRAHRSTVDADPWAYYFIGTGRLAGALWGQVLN